jgi:hypothetical protein
LVKSGRQGRCPAILMATGCGHFVSFVLFVVKNHAGPPAQRAVPCTASGRRYKMDKDSPLASLETQRHGGFEDGGSRKPATGLHSRCGLEADEPDIQIHHSNFILFVLLCLHNTNRPGKSDLAGPPPGLLLRLRDLQRSGW